MCCKHGANGECKTINCATNAEKRGGHCRTHGGRGGFCQAIPPCNTPAVPGKFVCALHGAHGICSVWGCTKNANQSGRGVCRAHDIKVLLCSAPDCPRKVVARRVCKKHGANGFCSFGNCKTAAVGKGRCARHGGGRTKECKVKDCDTLAIARGLCTKHGAYGTCATKGCATNARQGFQHCFKHSGGKKKPCSVAGCTTTARVKGLCQRHGAGPGQSSAGNCTTVIVGMRLWKTSGKRNRKVCLEDGCSNKAYCAGQLCQTHGGKPCAVDGCTTNAKARGVCDKHGANGKCKTINCNTNAEKRGGHCRKHGGRGGFCQAIPPCNTPAIPGKFVCTMHGAHGICSVWGCTKNANNSGRGVCIAHDIKVLCSTPDCPSKVVARRVCVKHGAYGFCSTAGCVAAAQGRGVCKKHGAKGFCSFGNCNTAAIKRGLCNKHGANGICSFGNCKSAAASKGRCVRHGGGRTKECKVKDCTTLAIARGLCKKHGANGTCATKGCTTNAHSGSKHCYKHGGGKKKPCSVAGCTINSVRKGLCSKHGGGPGQCYAGNCTKQIVGMWKTCAEHGGHGECTHPSGCRYPVLKRTKKDGRGFCKQHADA
eukprot:gene15300-biopygen14270